MLMPFFYRIALSLITMFYLVTACAPASTPQSSGSPARAAYEHVILNEGAWTPTAEMVATLEARLPAFLAQNQNKFNANKPPIAERLPEYKFQYWGENINGKQVIAVNALCRAPDNWRTQRVMVLDGGDCFFNFKYDFANDTFFDFNVNGEA